MLIPRGRLEVHILSPCTQITLGASGNVNTALYFYPTRVYVVRLGAYIQALDWPTRRRVLSPPASTVGGSITIVTFGQPHNWPIQLVVMRSPTGSATGRGPPVYGDRAARLTCRPTRARSHALHILLMPRMLNAS